MSDRWPGEGIRIRSSALELRPVRGEDLPAVQELLPDDLELDPAVPIGPGDRREARGAAFVSSLELDRDRFGPESWKLHLPVRTVAGLLVGVQTVEAEHFAVDRTVDSASWLAAPFRGRGIGTAMRAAVLAFAFDALGAAAAVSSAWHDNLASLGVSTRLGYRFDRVSRLSTPDRDDELVHVRLERSDWAASGAGSGITVEGVRPAEFGAA